MLVGLVMVISILGASVASGQVEYVDLPLGQKVVLKRQLRPGGQFFYAFTAKPGQTLTARLISANRRVVFSVDVVYNIRGPEIVSDTIVEGKRIWSGSLPDSSSDDFGVGVSSPVGRASYTLELTLR